MNATIHADPVPLQADDDGTIRVSGTRLTLDTIITAYQQGERPEAISKNFSPLLLEDVHAVIAYYLRHRDEVDNYLELRQREAEELRHKVEKRFPPEGIRDRLLARQSGQ
jgi:uncharacterized protein (DUF433 family)